MNSRIDGPANYAAAGQASQAQRECEIPKVLTSLFCEIDRYENLYNRISERIGCIVSPCPPQPTLDGGKLEKGLNTSLASEIHHQSCKLRRVSDDLQSLLDRIEL